MAIYFEKIFRDSHESKETWFAQACITDDTWLTDWLNCNERECVWRGLDRDIERGIAFTTNSDGFNEGYIKKHSDCLTTISLYQIQMLSGTLIFQIINYSLLSYKDIYYKENICTFKNITREMTSVSCEIGTVRGGANGRKWFIYSGTGIEYTSKISDM